MTHYLERPEEFGECRTLTGHRWSRNGTALVVEGKEITVHLTCKTCTTERTDHIHRHSGTVRRTYKHPDGYLLRLGPKKKRPEKAVLRVEYISYLLKEQRR